MWLQIQVHIFSNLAFTSNQADIFTSVFPSLVAASRSISNLVITHNSSSFMKTGISPTFPASELR